MSKPNEGVWYDGCELDNLLKSLINRKAPPSSKGHVPCPDCTGTILWVKDYQGYYYLRCFDCHRSEMKSKAN